MYLRENTWITYDYYLYEIETMSGYFYDVAEVHYTTALGGEETNPML